MIRRIPGLVIVALLLWVVLIAGGPFVQAWVHRSGGGDDRAVTAMQATAAIAALLAAAWCTRRYLVPGHGKH